MSGFATTWEVTQLGYKVDALNKRLDDLVRVMGGDEKLRAELDALDAKEAAAAKAKADKVKADKPTDAR